jgi:hypothetical protein
MKLMYYEIFSGGGMRGWGEIAMRDISYSMMMCAIVGFGW